MADKDFFGGVLKEGFYISQKTGERFVFYKNEQGDMIYDNAGLATHYGLEHEDLPVSELPNDLELRVFQPGLTIKHFKDLIYWIESKTEKLSKSPHFKRAGSAVILMSEEEVDEAYKKRSNSS